MSQENSSSIDKWLALVRDHTVWNAFDPYTIQEVNVLDVK